MKNKFIRVQRHYGNDNHTIGICTVFQTDLENDLITTASIKAKPFDSYVLPIFNSSSLERGWLDNKANVSCIPVGEYHCVWEYSPAFDTNLWEIYGVEGRTECKFHASNYFYNLKGCVALGLQVLDMDKDTNYDVTSSKNTMVAFHDSLRSMQGKMVKLIVE